MNKFKILVCEDSKNDQRNIALYILKVGRSFDEKTGIEIEKKIVDFSGISDELLLDYNLLILDLSDDEHGNIGYDVLFQNDLHNKIPVLIYTATGDSIGFELEKRRLEYPFLLQKLPKIAGDGTNLIEFLEGFIITSSPHVFYSLYNSDDQYLKLAIQAIGHNNLRYILYKIFENHGKREITIYPMPSGWSGAILFKLEMENDTFVLKVSRDINSLKFEHKNGMDLFSKFPSHFTISFEEHEYYSFDKSVIGILIKNVPNPTTLHEYILKPETTEDDISNKFEQLFLQPDALCDHYMSQTNKVKKNWTAIFENISDVKIQWVKDSVEELAPIFKRYGEDVNHNDFRRICIQNEYKSLDPSIQTDDNYQKELVLSHGDFHSRNILIQSGLRPIIIDTGALGYKHWAIDPVRLIVSLFVLGLDQSRIQYFEIDRLDYYINFGEKVISKEPFEITDGDENNNILFSINWLLINLEKIYPTQFSLFEFQLGLLKEFLQVSYRLETVPPNKRALALILAKKCLDHANENVVRRD